MSWWFVVKQENPVYVVCFWMSES